MNAALRHERPPADPPTTWSTPFQIDASACAAGWCGSGPPLDAILERHDYPRAVARLLAEMMALAAALATR